MCECSESNNQSQPALSTLLDLKCYECLVKASYLTPEVSVYPLMPVIPDLLRCGSDHGVIYWFCRLILCICWVSCLGNPKLTTPRTSWRGSKRRLGISGECTTSLWRSWRISNTISMWMSPTLNTASSYISFLICIWVTVSMSFIALVYLTMTRCHSNGMHRLNTGGVIQEVQELFDGHEELFVGFQNFLPATVECLTLF